MRELMINEAAENDLPGLLELLTCLGDNPLPEMDARVADIWSEIVHDKNHHVLLGLLDGKPVVSCAVIIARNLTHSQRPYAVVENVITHPEHRKKGFGSRILAAAKDIAEQNGCYKIMLMTGSKKESTLDFYRRAGYNSEDKTAFVQWLPAPRAVQQR